MHCSGTIRLASQRYANQALFKIARHLSSTAVMASTDPLGTKSLPDITATPAADQRVLHEGREYTTIQEGLAYILVPASNPKIPQTTPKGDNKPQDVFYNPIQQFNRDLSVLAIKAYGEQWFEQKGKVQESMKKKLAAKRTDKRDKKRKREDGGGSPSRKAGKVEASARSTEDAPPSDLVGGRHIPGEAQQQEEALGKTEDNPEEDGDAEASNQTLEHDIPAVDATHNPVDDAVVDSSALETPTTTTEEKQSTEQRSKAFTILDALSATGLRALRYSHEIPFTTSVTANDLLPSATQSINLNINHNRLTHKITATTSNAMAHMYSLLDDSTRDARNHPQWSRKYNVIDLDPYGTAAPFLDAAVQAVRDDGGLLCVTCTDAGVWASNGYPEKCFALYGGTPIKGQQSHEGGLRLILHAIATSAARYGLAMQPLLSLSIDFYARVFVRIHRSPAEVKFLSGKTMMVYNCDGGCGAWTTQLIGRNKHTQSKKGTEMWKHQFAQGPTTSERCEHCGYITHIAGPMYAGPLHDPLFIKRILDALPAADKDVYKTLSRVEGMLTLALEECLPTSSACDPASENAHYSSASLDPTPFLFLPSTLSKVVHCVTPVENAFRGALRGLGYRVTRSHTKAGSIKTDAPWAVVWEVMREWVRQKHPVKEGAVREGTAGWKILGLGKEKEKEGEAGGEGRQGANGEEIAGQSEKGTGAEKADVKEPVKVVFDESLGREKDAKKLVRYQVNPRDNWGPMARAKGKA